MTSHRILRYKNFFVRFFFEEIVQQTQDFTLACKVKYLLQFCFDRKVLFLINLFRNIGTITFDWIMSAEKKAALFLRLITKKFVFDSIVNCEINFILLLIRKMILRNFDSFFYSYVFTQTKVRKVVNSHNLNTFRTLPMFHFFCGLM